jgi:hypothetical protein
MKLKLAGSVATVLFAGGAGFVVTGDAVIAFLSVFLFAPCQLILLWLWCPHCRKLAFANGNRIDVRRGCPNCGTGY